jgi:hypothetical protein
VGMRLLREDLWKIYGVNTKGNDVPSSFPAPNDVTLMVTVDDAGVVNAKHVIDLLHAHKKALGMNVRPYSPTLGVPLASLVKRMAQTKVLIARHGSLMGCAVLLSPGSIVVELMPYRYDGFDTFGLYSKIMGWLGDVRHLTLAMNTTESIVYLSDEDAKYDSWLPGECYGFDCMEAHELAGLKVPLDVLNGLLEGIEQALSSADGRAGVGAAETPEMLRLLSLYAHPKRATRTQTHAGIWYDDV